MAISKYLKDKAQKTREDGVFTLKLEEGVLLAGGHVLGQPRNDHSVSPPPI